LLKAPFQGEREEMVWLAGFRGKEPFRGVFLRGVLGGLWEVGFGGWEGGGVGGEGGVAGI
jgi:hypothetical protein